MNQAIKYALGVVVGFCLGAVSSYLVTMHYMGKFMNYTFTSMEVSDAIQIINTLNKIRSGNAESALANLEQDMGNKLVPIVYPMKNISELSESELKASKMAVEYWSNFPEAKGQELVRTKIEGLVNAK